MSTVGILGGGQLAQMLVMAAHKIGLSVAVLSENSEDPAAQVCPQWHQGSFKNPQDLEQFFHQVDLLSFESEFIDVKKIRDAIKRSKTNLSIYPSLDAIETLQDRKTQKEILDRFKIATARWAPLTESVPFKKAVIKKRIGGYDGYGTWVIKTKTDLEKFFESQSRNTFNSPGFIVEAFVPFRRELSLLAARDQFGKVVFYPVVETFQHNNRCLWVKGPQKAPRSLRLLKSRIRKMLSHLKYVGVIAFELFESKNSDYELLVNEIAPRVHNSGHVTQNSFAVDQFLAHMICVSGGRLQELTPHTKGYAMLNILGSSLKDDFPQGVPFAPSNTWLHWYGKSPRPGRKMGHINAIADTPEQALKSANHWSSKICAPPKRKVLK